MEHDKGGALQVSDVQKRKDLISKMNSRMRSLTKYADENTETLRRFVPTGGIKLVGILLKKYPKKDTAYSQQFDVLLGSVRQQPDMPQEMFIGQSGIRIRVNPPTPKKDDDTVFMAQNSPPETFDFFSFSTHRLSTSNFQSLTRIEAYDMVFLNGVSAKASLPTSEFPEHKVFLNVNMVEKFGDVNMIDLYTMDTNSKNLAPSWLKPCTKEYNELDKSLRYDRSEMIIVDVRSKTPSNYEEITALKYVIKMIPVRVKKTKNNQSIDPWVRQDANKIDRIHANLSYAIEQWSEGEYDADNKTLQTILLDVTMYEEVLEPLGIKTARTWEKLAPYIFSNLDFKIIGYVDIKSSQSNFGGVNNSENSMYNFALTINASCMIGDIASTYKKMGVPLTKKWIETHYNVKSDPSDVDFIPPAVICVDDQDNKPLCGKLLAAKNTEFIALLAVQLRPDQIESIQRLSPEEGSELMRFIENSDLDMIEEGALPPENIVYQMLKTFSAETSFFVFAITQRTSLNLGSNDNAHQLHRIKQFYDGIGSDQPLAICDVDVDSITDPSSGENVATSVDNSQNSVDNSQISVDDQELSQSDSENKSRKRKSSRTTSEPRKHSTTTSKKTHHTKK